MFGKSADALFDFSFEKPSLSKLLNPLLVGEKSNVET